MVLEGLRAVLAFLTIIPMRSGSLEDAAKKAWLFPLIGAALAIFPGAVGELMNNQIYIPPYVLINLYFPPHVSAAVALFLLMVLSGFHHLDGLLDIGDALMFRGTREEKIEVMHDTGTGAGGFGLGFFVILISYAALVWAPNMFLTLIIAETLAKFSMVLGLYAGTPSHQGIGDTFLRSTHGNIRMLILATIFTALLVSPLGLGGGVLMVVTAIFSLILIRYFNRTFGGMGGDTFGALNEMTRMIILLAML